MIRAMVRRALVLTAAFAAGLTPVACLGESSKPVAGQGNEGTAPPSCSRCSSRRRCRNIHRSLCAFSRKRRSSKSGNRTRSGRFQILKTYPICRWSGDLGPKLYEGDRQAPEGFYTVTPELMNPNSNFYLSINLGYPNKFDKANKRDGSFLMIHGDCWSSGCYAMTDEQISEIYSLARDSFSAAGRRSRSRPIRSA